MKKFVSLILAAIMLFIACAALAEGQGEPLYATVGEALKAEKVFSAGGGEDYYAVVTEKDGKYYRSVANADGKLGSLFDAAIEAGDETREAAWAEYDNYLNALPIAYSEEFTAVPMTQEETDAAFVGKTIGELEEAGYVAETQGTESGATEDEIIVVYTFRKGLFIYACVVDVDFDTYFKILDDEPEKEAALKVKSASLAGLSNESYDKRFHTDGTVDEPEDPFAVWVAADELAKQFTAEDGSIDLAGLEAALKEQFPDKPEEIEGVIQMYKFALLSQSLVPGTADAPTEEPPAEETPAAAP